MGNNKNTVRLCPDRQKRIDKTLSRFVWEEKKYAGLSYAVGQGENILKMGCIGQADREAGREMAEDTIFRIASMTKPVTAAALMTLYEEGHFQLNTPVSEFLPLFKDVKVYDGETPEGEVRLADPVRPVLMRHLFTHTAGLSYGWKEDDPVDRLYRQAREKSPVPHEETTLEQMTDMLARLPLAFQPGSEWRYSLAIDLLGRIIEIISGKSLDQFLEERIFYPLGMEDTGFWVPPEKTDRLAALYGRPEGEKEFILMEKPGESRNLRKPSFLSGGGGLYSSLPDYSRFLAMLSSRGRFGKEQLLSPSTVEMFSRNLMAPEALPYGFADGEDYYHMGYGYSLATRVLMDPAATGQAGNAGEFGWDGAFNTYFWVDPAIGLFGLLMTQHHPNNYFPLAQTFKQLVYQAIV